MKLMTRIFAALMTLALIATVGAQGDPALELAKRLMGPWGSGAGYSSELIVGDLPADLPDPLPLPESVEVVGSFTNIDAEGELMFAQIVLDSELDPQEAVDELSEEFRSAGWTTRSQGGQTGFLPSNQHVYLLLCSPTDMSYIYVNSFVLDSGATDIRLEVNSQQYYSPCEDQMAWEGEGPVVPLPALPAPTGSQVEVHGGSYYDDQASSSALIRTEMPADELLVHYERQLGNSGWDRLDDEPMRTGQSVWSLVQAERSWRGVLVLIEPIPGEPVHYATFVMMAEVE